MRVGENPKEIIDRIVSYKRKIFAGNLEV